jgi:Tol biopolymer transport system component
MLRKMKLSLLSIGGSLLILAILAACGSSERPSPTQDVQLPIIGSGDVSPAYPGPQADSGYPGPGQTTVEFPPVPADVAFFVPPPEGIPTFPGKLLFQTERYGILQVALLAGDSGEVTRVTNVPTQAFEPDWSPDCSAIAYTEEVGNNQDFDIYIHDIASGQRRPLVTGSGAYDWAPAWSPDGSIIAYQNNQDALINICFITPTGERLGCMERGSYSNAMPAWSPDGTRLAFGSNRAGNWELYVTDYPAMSTLTRLTNNNDIDFHPQFSPDGQWIVFTSKRLGSYDLYLVGADGQNERQLTTLASDERDPTWVGNDRIAFTANIEDDWELYIINVDGSNLQRLTYTRGADQWPVWCSAE